MPAIDDCEPQVIRALEKDGWAVKRRPYAIRLKNTVVMADVLMQRETTEEELLLVEIKCFPESSSVLEQFYRAVGQYQLYRAALERLQLDIVPVLSVPQHIYEQFIQVEDDAQSVLQHAKINIVVVNLDDEEVVSWLR